MEELRLFDSQTSSSKGSAPENVFANFDADELYTLVLSAAQAAAGGEQNVKRMQTGEDNIKGQLRKSQSITWIGKWTSNDELSNASSTVPSCSHFAHLQKCFSTRDWCLLLRVPCWSN